jgi:hypothetical protein
MHIGLYDKVRCSKVIRTGICKLTPGITGITKLTRAYLSFVTSQVSNIACLVALCVEKFMNYIGQITGLCLALKSGHSYRLILLVHRQVKSYIFSESLIQIEG